MLAAKFPPPQFRGQAAPRIVKEADTRTTVQQHLKVCGAAPLRFGSEFIFCGGKLLLKVVRPVNVLAGSETGAPFDDFRLAEAAEDLWFALFPENVFQCERNEGSPLDARGQMTQPGFELHRRFPHVGKLSLRREPED